METARQANVVVVVFHEHSKRYHYFCPYPVRVDDHVVVDAPYSGYSCVKVVDVLPQGSIKATKPVIQVVDDSDYKANIERQKRRAEIERKLEKRAQEISKLQFYRQLAAMDPDAKALVDELETLAA